MLGDDSATSKDLRSLTAWRDGRAQAPSCGPRPGAPQASQIGTCTQTGSSHDAEMTALAPGGMGVQGPIRSVLEQLNFDQKAVGRGADFELRVLDRGAVDNGLHCREIPVDQIPVANPLHVTASWIADREIE